MDTLLEITQQGAIVFWIVFSILFLIAAFATRKLRWNEEAKPLISYGLLGFWALVTVLLSINTVPAGHIGLVKTFAEYTGKQQPGLHLKAPFQTVDKVDGRVLKATVSLTGGKKGSAVSIETQPVYATLVVNYQLELDHATKLYNDVGEDYYAKIVEPVVQQAFKAVTVEYKTIDIAPKREAIREKVRAAIDDQLKAYGIDVKDLLIKNLDFSNAFVNAIEKKQVATEDAKAAAERVAIAKADADSAVATARGKADSAVVAARGEAKAISIKGAALRQNPNSLQLAWIEKINPGVQTIYLPSGSSNLIQIPQTVK